MEADYIDYMLRNFEVSNILQVQQKLKSDVEKKQNELKLLIGERYNELFRATDSFETMNFSLSNLIGSLKNLKNFIQHQNVDHPHLDDNYLSKMAIFKFLIELPVQIWDYLRHENFVLATYSYFYGNYISEFFKSNQNISLQEKLFSLHIESFENLKCYIIQNCWLKIGLHSTSKDIDYLKFAEIFSCLIILQNYTLSELIVELFEKQSNNIHSRLIEEKPISSLIEIVINIIFNTIKCSKIFRKDLKGDSILAENFKYIINFSTGTLNNQTSYLAKLPDNLTNFTIQSQLKHNCFDIKQEDVFTWTSIEEWIRSIQKKYFEMVEKHFKNIMSIKELFLEINAVEKNQMEEFKDWKEYSNIVGMIDWIFQKWFIDVFENRVYEITEKKLQLINGAFVSLLPLFKQKLLHCDLNIAEFVWKEHFGKNNDFISSIIKCCEIIDNQMKSFYEDIMIFRDNYQHFLQKIYSNIHRFIFSLKEHIDSYKEIRPFLLFGAVFFQKISELSPSLSAIFFIKKDLENCLSWNEIENEVKSISESYLLDWFVIIISEHFSKINPNTFIDLTEFLQNFSLWETISLTTENDKENAKTLIEVPIQLSLRTFQILQNICIDINRFCAHMVPKKVLINILIVIGKHLISLYETSINDLGICEHIPKASKQIISLQLYFDLFFIKKIFTSTRDETLRTNYLMKINELMTLLESNIDPFDMHLIHPYIEINSDKLHKSYQITLGFLFLERYSSSSSQSNLSKNNKEIIHNLMLAYSCQEEFKIIKYNPNE